MNKQTHYNFTGFKYLAIKKVRNDYICCETQWDNDMQPVKQDYIDLHSFAHLTGIKHGLLEVTTTF